MQDEEKKLRKPRRSKEEIAADYQRRAMRIRHAGARDALSMLDKAVELIEEADAATRSSGIDISEMLSGASESVSQALERLRSAIPPEAR